MFTEKEKLKILLNQFIKSWDEEMQIEEIKKQLEDPLQIFSEAIIKGDSTKIKNLLSKKKVSVNAQLGNYTPLLIAAAHDQLSIIKILLHCGASLQARDTLGNTALLLASRNGHYQTVKFLLEKTESSLEERDIFGNTAILVATQGFAWAPEISEEEMYDVDKIYDIDYLNLIDYLIQQGASLQDKNKEGKTIENFIPKKYIEGIVHNSELLCQPT